MVFNFIPFVNLFHFLSFLFFPFSISFTVSFSSQAVLMASRSSFTISSKAPRDGATHLLAYQRKNGMFKLCDIQLIVEGQMIYVHSAIVGVYSRRFYRLITQEETPPFSFELPNTSLDSVNSILDWMYFGEAKFSDNLISHLSTAAYFEIPELTKLLEKQLLRLSTSPSTLLNALSVVVDDRTKVTDTVATTIVDRLVTSGASIVSSLPSKVVKYLLGRKEVNLQKKTKVVNVVLKWLKSHPIEAVKVLDHLENTNLSEKDEKILIDRLLSMILTSRGEEQLRLEVDRNERIVITSGVETPSQSPAKGPLVSQVEPTSPLRTYKENNKYMGYSPVRDIRQEIDALPNVFKTPEKSQKPADKMSSYVENGSRLNGYVSSSYNGRFDMPIVIDRTPAAKNSSSYSTTSSAPKQIIPFTAESIADIHQLPDLFVQRKSDYEALKNNKISSTYAFPSGPTYYGHSQPQVRESVKVELPNGTTLIPHAAHPMLPNARPYIEVHVPHKGTGPNYESTMKFSDYVGNF